MVGGGGNGLHFCVGSDVCELLGEVVSAGNNAVVGHYQGPYGDFAFFKGARRLCKSKLHKISICKNRFHHTKVHFLWI